HAVRHRIDLLEAELGPRDVRHERREVGVRKMGTHWAKTRRDVRHQPRYSIIVMVHSRKSVRLMFAMEWAFRSDGHASSRRDSSFRSTCIHQSTTLVQQSAFRTSKRLQATRSASLDAGQAAALRPEPAKAARA